MTISLGRSQYPFAGGGGKAHTQAGPPSTTAVTAPARTGAGTTPTGSRRRVAEHRHMARRAPGPPIPGRGRCRGQWQRDHPPPRGPRVRESRESGWPTCIQRGHLDDRVSASAMTRCHAGFSRILSSTPSNPATISVASSSERVSSRASSLSVASNWRVSSGRVMLRISPVAEARSPGQPDSRTALAPSGIAPPGER
jgi:hypothetical protein